MFQKENVKKIRNIFDLLSEVGGKLNHQIFLTLYPASYISALPSDYRFSGLSNLKCLQEKTTVRPINFASSNSKRFL